MQLAKSSGSMYAGCNQPYEVQCCGTYAPKHKYPQSIQHPKDKATDQPPRIQNRKACKGVVRSVSQSINTISAPVASPSPQLTEPSQFPNRNQYLARMASATTRSIGSNGPRRTYGLISHPQRSDEVKLQSRGLPAFSCRFRIRSCLPARS